MKILHISTSDRGGAGIAAKRLHLGLLEAGIESKMLCLKVFDRTVPNVFEHPALPPLTLKKRLLYKFKLYKPTWAKKKQLINDLKGNYEIYTFPFSDFRIHEHPLVKEADIINLHWVADFINYSTFFKYVQKPIVWTLHDMNPFLGGFHYLNDVKNNNKFNDLEEYLKRIKQKSYSQNQNLNIVTLSNYIKKNSERSSLLGQYPHHLIFNGYEPILNKDVDINICKRVFGIPTNKKVILFVSQNLKNHRKGFDLLLDAIKKNNPPDEFVFAAIGSNQPSTEKIKWLGEIHDQLLLEMAYRMSDAFLLPSREDNLPNTMLEALTQGVPVITFSIGGMSDVINEENGILMKECSSEKLQKALNEIFKGIKNFDKKTIETESKNTFSLQKQAKEYIRLYESIIPA